LLLLLLVSSSACGHNVGSTIPQEAPAEDTTLGPGDVFEIRVFGEKDLTGKYQVGPDGSIDFPFLGSINAAGKEANALAEEIADQLEGGGYLKAPQVSIFVEQSNSKRVSVLGAVAKPGTLPIIPGMTVVQAVSQAGGFTPLAGKDDTVVTRRIAGKLERYRVPVSEITKGIREDFPLRSGDIVFVPERMF